MQTKTRDLPGIATPLLEDGRYRPALERQPMNALTHPPLPAFESKLGSETILRRNWRRRRRIRSAKYEG